MNYEAIPFSAAEGNRRILLDRQMESFTEDFSRESCVVVDEEASGREA